jgi:hypothetical protein
MNNRLRKKPLRQRQRQHAVERDGSILHGGSLFTK